MKQFYNLMEALGYHTTCYVCGSRLKHDLQTDYDNNFLPQFKWNLSHRIDTDTDDWITIDGRTNKIIYAEPIRRYDRDSIYDGSQTFRHRKYDGSVLERGGTLYESIQVECEKCSQFYYVLQIIIDVSARQLIGIFLNAECISYKDSSGNFHRIKNLYSKEKTSYYYPTESTADYDTNTKNILVPLIPINFQNPTETVVRIKKLSVFS